jgi:hypothetical protein
VIDANDTAFSQLHVWVNPEQDGVVHPGELLTLAQLGIVSISLTTVASTTSINGNDVRLIASYTLADGTTREIADVWFANSPTYTRPDVAVTPSTAVAALHELSGYGLMRDLQSAATLDAQLLTDVQALVAGIAKDPALTLAAINTLMLEWSGSTAVDPNSRRGFINGAGLNTLFDARELGTLNFKMPAARLSPATEVNSMKRAVATDNANVRSSGTARSSPIT